MKKWWKEIALGMLAFILTILWTGNTSHGLIAVAVVIVIFGTQFKIKKEKK